MKFPASRNVTLAIIALAMFALGVVAGRLWFTPRPPPDVFALPSETAVATPAKATQAAPAPDAADPTDAAAAARLRGELPDLATVSVAEGTRTLRENALEKFKDAAVDAQTKRDAAQRQLARAQSGGSETETEAARKNLQRVQFEQDEKLKQVAEDLQTQIGALQQIKTP